jgi:ubiquinone/menaquinone biosynthesis C-methylase UbiE
MIPNLVTDTIMDQTAEHTDNLELYLTQIYKIFDVPRMINEPQGKPQIINYYHKNAFLIYRLFHNWEGFMHCGISYDGRHKKDDFKEQAKIVERYIHDSNAKNVLELAYGWGANSAFLAKRNPEVTFEGIDLSLNPLKRFTKISNLRFQSGDYHDLSAFKDDSYDIVFVIEALCCSTNKSQVLREVKKKLRKGGLFIVIDAYRRERTRPLSHSEEVMAQLIEKGFSVDKFERVEDVEGYMQEVYSIVAAKDITQCVLPCMAKGKWARHYFSHPAFARTINKLLSFDVVKNTIVALLIEISIKRQIACYYVHVLKNDK